MKTLTVGQVVGILIKGIEKGDITKDTKVLLTDDDEVNGVHAMYAYSYMSQEDAKELGYNTKHDEMKEDEQYIVLG